LTAIVLIRAGVLKPAKGGKIEAGEGAEHGI